MKKFQNILVAFDLNKTLFFKSQSPLPRMHDKKIKKLFFYVRPHIKQLITFLHNNQINYCFWSNMLGRNCVKYVAQLQLLGMNKHCGIFDQQFCDTDQNKTVVIGQKIKFIKNLNKLAALFNIDVDSCILVDDSKQKNVQGCHLIHVNSYEGQQVDKDLLEVIDRIAQFRKTRVNVQQKIFPMLQRTEQKWIELPKKKEPQKKVEIEQKPKEPTEIELLYENHPQLKKMKADLINQKQTKKNIIKEIQIIQKANVEMAEQIKKRSEGKVLRKGDQLLVQVLTFAKNKKASQKKIEQLLKKKKVSEQKITIIKKLMQSIIKQLNPKAHQAKQEQTNSETPENICSDVKRKKSKKNNKNVEQQKKQTIENKQIEKPQAEQATNEKEK